MYSTRYCGFCVAARKLLQRRGYVFEEVDVSHDNALRHEVSKRAGNYTFSKEFYMLVDQVWVQ